MALFPNIDLNLIKLFSVLYKTGSVKATADELNLSQSACSHALQRLRDRLGDDLFVRIGNRMLPTEYSTQISKDLVLGMDMIGKGLRSSLSFNPDEEHVFRIAVTDYTSWCMQPFISYLSQTYPNIHIEFLRLEERLPEKALRDGELDLVCGFTHQPEYFESLSSTIWFEDSYINVRCHHHPLKTKLTMNQFLSYKHVLVTPWNESRGIVDITLSKLKKKRQIAVKTTSVLASPTFILNTPYLLSSPQKYIHQIKKRLPVIISPLPLEVPNYKVTLYWHKTRNNDPKIQWICQHITQLDEGKQ